MVIIPQLRASGWKTIDWHLDTRECSNFHQNYGSIKLGTIARVDTILLWFGSIRYRSWQTNANGGHNDGQQMLVMLWLGGDLAGAAVIAVVIYGRYLHMGNIRGANAEMEAVNMIPPLNATRTYYSCTGVFLALLDLLQAVCFISPIEIKKPTVLRRAWIPHLWVDYQNRAALIGQLKPKLKSRRRPAFVIAVNLSKDRRPQ